MKFTTQVSATFTLAFFLSGAASAQTPSPVKPTATKPKAMTAKPRTPRAAKSAGPGAPAAPVAASAKSRPVITVGSQTITQGEFEDFLESLPQQYRSQATGPMKREFAEQLAKVKVLSDSARKQGLDKEKSLQTRMILNNENLLAGAAFAELSKNVKVDDATARKYFEEHKQDFEQASARHILIRFKGSQVPLKEGQKDLTEEEALAKASDLRKQIVAGADFAAIATKESDDTGSGEKGGDLGSFKHGAMVPAFDQAAFSQKIGEVGEPLKTQFGYHVIQVQKRAGFEDVRADVETKMRPEVAREAVETLAKQANIIYDEQYFGPPAPAAAPRAPSSKPVPPVTPAPK